MYGYRDNKKQVETACQPAKKYFLALLLFILFACTDDHVSKSEQISTIQFAPALAGYGFGNEAESDNRIEEFRILVFDDAGNFTDNIYLPGVTANMPLGISLTNGTYNFVFIGNEGSDAALHTLLAAWGSGKTLSDVSTLCFASSAFETGKNIPMSAIYRNVQIVGQEYIIDGVSQTGIWRILMKRLGIRIDLRIKTTSEGKRKNFTKLDIYNIPKNVPLFEQDLSGNTLYNGGAGNYETTPRSYDVSLGDDGGFQWVNGGYEWVKSHIILPSSLFTPDTEANAMTFKANYSDRTPETAILKTAGSSGHQLSRNTYFLVDAVLQPTSFEVVTKVQDWDQYLIDSDLITKINLNVSAINVHVSEYHMGRVTFTSDQRNVYLESRTVEGYDMDDIFYGLTGDDAYNFHYEYDEITERGTGYFDIIVDRNKTLLAEKNKTSVGIILNASGLKRIIQCNILIAPSVFGKYDYVGAFWKNDQTGERMITMRNTQSNGYWTVDVIEGTDWIVLDNKKSLDPYLWTDNPGDAEMYQVDSKLTYISGYGHLFFRIGLTGTNPATTPRYGLIKVDKNGTIIYIYVRQGEEPDYLMRPEDTNGSGGWLGASGATEPRPLAVKFSPYNLTAQQYIDSVYTTVTTLDLFPRLAIKGGVFTSYPSQAGAHFLWSAQASASYARVVIPPSYPYTSISGYPNQNATSTNYWDKDKATFETCPQGYRRINDGEENTRVSTPYVRTSEIRQSLWLNPLNSTMNSVVDNSLFGYYADGFFDRHVIEDANNLYSEAFDEIAIMPMSTYVAYAGRLFYNPVTNASLFFPAIGYRSVGSGVLLGAGKMGNYWTSTSFATSSSYHLVIGNDTYASNAGIAQYNRNYGYAIRCVADD